MEPFSCASPPIIIRPYLDGVTPLQAKLNVWLGVMILLAKAIYRFYQQLGVTLSWQQYLGEGIDMFNDGNYYNNPRSMSVGVTYTPVPLVTVSASHKEAREGEPRCVWIES